MWFGEGCAWSKQNKMLFSRKTRSFKLHIAHWNSYWPIWKMRLTFKWDLRSSNSENLGYVKEKCIDMFLSMCQARLWKGNTLSRRKHSEQSSNGIFKKILPSWWQAVAHPSGNRHRLLGVPLICQPTLLTREVDRSTPSVTSPYQYLRSCYNSVLYNDNKRKGSGKSKLTWRNVPHTTTKQFMHT